MIVNVVTTSKLGPPVPKTKVLSKEVLILANDVAIGAPKVQSPPVVSVVLITSILLDRS